MRHRFWPILVLLVLLSGCSGYEKRDENIYQGYQGKARLNQYYAAERLLSRLGVDAESVQRLSEPPQAGPNDSVILSTPSYTLSANSARQWLAWVRQGGQLIISLPSHPNPVQDKTDNLLDTLGIGQQDAATGQTLRVSLAQNTPLTVTFRGSATLLDRTKQAAWSVAKNERTELLHYRIGQGTMTVLSDLSMLSNRAIGNHDHADFLWQLVHLNGAPDKVWLQFMPQIPSLFTLIWRHAWMVIVAFALTLTALIWTANRRLGPVLLPLASRQRSLLDHIRASGRFYWRHGAGAELLAAARQHTLKHWHLSGTGANPKEIEQMIAEKSRLSQKRIESALNGRRVKSAHDFYRTVKSLQQIEKNL